MEYLKESYGGKLINPNSCSSYYCYTIYDQEHGLYYSGSRGIEGRDTHDLLISYFTSSSVRDFKNRLKVSPEQFDYNIEYFDSRKQAM